MTQPRISTAWRMTTDIDDPESQSLDAPPRSTPRLLRRCIVGILLSVATLAGLFWPVVAYRHSIQFDRAVFTTEWLKIAFSSVILFGIVEVLLDRNRTVARRAALHAVFANQVLQPLRSAAALATSTLPTLSIGAPHDISDVLHRLSRYYERITLATAQLGVAATDPVLAAGLLSLGQALAGYDWSDALRELAETSNWRHANVTEFDRLTRHLNALHEEARLLSPH
jgi:hypothetical protein